MKFHKDRFLQAIHEYGLFAAGTLAGLGIVVSAWFAVGAFAILLGLWQLGHLKEMGIL